MRYQAILFDMDGTVLDTLRDLNAAVNQTLAHFGYPVQSIDDTRRFVGNGSRRLIELSVQDGMPDERIDELLAWYLPYYNAHANDTTAPYPGIRSVLDAFHRDGLPMAIVSNKPDRTVKKLAEQHFAGLFSCAVGEDEAHGIRRKPAPDTLLAAASALCAQPERCLYVGDSEVDILTASRAGMDCASALWGFRSREELLSAGARFLINKPEELYGFLHEQSTV